ncbi:MAG: c-type cytochrome [Candidatus Puniceispirillum sp.]|nr:c-type cytochrome [Candidatus Puniceispirillum sp.]
MIWLFLYLFLAVFVPLSASAFDRFTAHGGPVRDLALSPDGNYLVTASFDYSAVLWSANDIAEKTTLLGHEAALNTAQFSPDGKLLATGGDDGLVLIWPAEKLEDPAIEPIILRGHKGKIVDLAFSADNSMLASASWDGSIGIWPLDAGPEKAEANSRFITGHEGPVNAVQFSDDSAFLYSAGYDGQIRYWRLKNGEYLRSIVRNGWGISVFAVDETRDIVAFGSSDGVMSVARISDQSELLRVGDERVPVLSLFYRVGSGLIGFGNAKGRVFLADTKDWSVVRDFNAANGPIWSLLVLPDQQSLVVAGLDDFITRWPIFEFPPEFLDKPGPARRFHPKQTVSNGELQFARKCSVCHTLTADGKRRAGPTLFGVFGRRAGGLEGYPYSSALQNSDIIWTAATINRLFEEGPDKVTPGTKMPIQRMKNAQDREDLVSFLQSATQN